MALPALSGDVGATSSPHANALYLSVTQFDATGNDSEISVSHSTNGGTTWTRSAVDTAQVFPQVDQFSDLAIGKDGTVYASWMHCSATAGECVSTQATFLLSRSADGGTTWSTPVTLAMVTLASDPSDCCFSFETLIEQRNGSSWKVVPSLDIGIGTGGTNLQGVAAITARNVWAVGYQVNSSTMPQTLIEQYCC